MSLPDPLKIVRKATDVLETYAIRYLVGGSLASSLHGIPRATQDVDIVADLDPQTLEKIIPPLRADFYVDEEMARKAVHAGSAFNIIDREYIYKIDLFVLGNDSLSVTEMNRRVRYTLAESENQSLYLCTPEDIIAHKLYWFKLGGEVSERQLSDVRNVMKVQGRHLDMEYLRSTCAGRGVEKLLERLLTSG